MAVEFLLVIFPEDRDVLADGDRVGVTNHTILLEPNEYEITLSGTEYAPASQDVVVAGTSIMRPRVVLFAPTASAAAAVADVAAGGVAAGLPVGTGLPQPAARGRRRQRGTG